MNYRDELYHYGIPQTADGKGSGRYRKGTGKKTENTGSSGGVKDSDCLNFKKLNLKDEKSLKRANDAADLGIEALIKIGVVGRKDAEKKWSQSNKLWFLKEPESEGLGITADLVNQGKSSNDVKRFVNEKLDSAADVTFEDYFVDDTVASLALAHDYFGHVSNFDKYIDALYEVKNLKKIIHSATNGNNELYHTGTPQNGGRPGSGRYEEGTGERPWQHQAAPSRGQRIKNAAKKAVKGTGKAAGKALKRIGKGTANVSRNIIDSLVARGIAPTFLMSDASIRRGMERAKLKAEYKESVIKNKYARKKVKALAKKELKKVEKEDIELGKNITNAVIKDVVIPIGSGIALNAVSNAISNSGLSEQSKKNILNFVKTKNSGGNNNQQQPNNQRPNNQQTDKQKNKQQQPNDDQESNQQQQPEEENPNYIRRKRRS